MRSTGLKNKFCETDDVLAFQAHVGKHLWAHGLESIAYLPDPSDTSQVLSVVESHPKYIIDISKTEELAKEFKS